MVITEVLVCICHPRYSSPFPYLPVLELQRGVVGLYQVDLVSTRGSRRLPVDFFLQFFESLIACWSKLRPPASKRSVSLPGKFGLVVQVEVGGRYHLVLKFLKGPAKVKLPYFPIQVLLVSQVGVEWQIILVSFGIAPVSLPVTISFIPWPLEVVPIIIFWC